MQDQYLVHHGIKGQKWGIRRYQNEDGTLTEAGRKRYGYNDDGTQRDAGKPMERKAYQTALNKQEKARAHNRADQIKYERKAERAKSIKKYDKMMAKAEEYKKLVNEGQSTVNDLLSQASSKGYSFDSSTGLKYQRWGKTVTAQLFGGLAWSIPYGALNYAAHNKQQSLKGGESQAFTYRTTYR